MGIEDKDNKKENEIKKDEHKTVTTPAYTTPKKNKPIEKKTDPKKEDEKELFTDSSEALEALLDGKDVETIPFEEKEPAKEIKINDEEIVVKKDSETSNKNKPEGMKTQQAESKSNDSKKWWIIGGISFAGLILICCCIGVIAFSYLGYTEY